MTADEIRTVATALGGIAEILRRAEPADKIEIYREAGLKPTYQPVLALINAEAEPRGSCTSLCPRGESNPHALQICTPEVCM
jgi:hypothetical protein